MPTSYDVVIVGAGSAGITVAAQLRKCNPALRLVLLDPADKHYYQPLFTLVGGGVSRLEESVQPMANVIPDGVEWRQQAVQAFLPEVNAVEVGGELIHYRALVVAPGIQVNWKSIPGLVEALGKNGVCSNYSPDTVEYTWHTLRQFRGGNALFTFPATPVKCAGAPQKIMYLAEHCFRKNNVRNRSEVFFTSAGAAIFAVKKYADALSQVISDRGIHTRFKHNLVAIDGAKKAAIYEVGDSKDKVVLPFDMIHVTPPQSAPDFVRQSALANKDGWVDVDKETLQHQKFANIFSLGDASSLPTSKTGAAVRKQAPVLVTNLVSFLENRPLSAKYDGYTSCPLVTAYGKLILAEFDYQGNPRETFPFNQAKERLSMYLLKKYGLPMLYWQGMLKGHA